MYKLIAVDLDETLLNDEKHVSNIDVHTINAYSDIYFVIATGRGFMDVQSTLKEIGYNNKKNTYLISTNGACITENYNNTIIYINSMNFKDVKTLFDISLKYNLCSHIYTPSGVYTNKLYENERQLLIKGNFLINNIENNDISFLENKTITKVLFSKEDIPYLKELRKKLNLEDRFSISLSSNRYLEFNSKGIDKGKGLLKLCEILNIDVNDTIGVGDNINDIPLIKTAGLGIGVKNTIDEVIPYCDVILDSTNNESPITEIYNKYVKKN